MFKFKLTERYSADCMVTTFFDCAYNSICNFSKNYLDKRFGAIKRMEGMLYKKERTPSPPRLGMGNFL